MRLRDLELHKMQRLPSSELTGSIVRSVQPVERPFIDEKDMFASAVINTDRLDRQRGIIVADGLSVDDYEKNPVVLYEHGLGDVKHPIGQSLSPEGEFTLRKSELSIEATSYHSKAAKWFPIVYQLFGLIAEGVIRSASVQATPIKQSFYADKVGNKYTLTELSSMAEWSWCCIGVNPEALKLSSIAGVDDLFHEAGVLQTDSAAVVLNRGTIGNTPLLPAIYKSLRAMVPAATPTSSGFNFQESDSMTVRTITAEQLKGADESDLRLMHGNLEEFCDASQVLIKSMYDDLQDVEDDEDTPSEDGNGDEPSSEAPGDETPEGADTEQKAARILPGAKRLTALYKTLSAIASEFEEQFADVEAPEVRKGALGAITELRSNVMTSLQGIYASQYADHPAMDHDEGVDRDDSDDSEVKSLMKSYLAENQQPYWRTQGLVSGLERVASDPAIPEACRKSLLGYSTSLSSIADAAKSYVPEAPEGMVPKSDLDKANANLAEALDYIERMKQPAS